jgi:hypothetical protein
LKFLHASARFAKFLPRGEGRMREIYVYPLSLKSARNKYKNSVPYTHLYWLA